MYVLGSIKNDNVGKTFDWRDAFAILPQIYELAFAHYFDIIKTYLSDAVDMTVY